MIWPSRGTNNAQKRGMAFGLSRLYLILWISLLAMTCAAAPNRQARMAELTSKSNYINGPNCWDATFYITGHYPHLIFVSSIQAADLFETYCRQIKVSPQDAYAGSILRLQEDNGIEVHAAIKVGTDRYFQKRGYAGKSEPYQFSNLAKMDSTYECSENTPNCKIVKSVYSCPAPPASTTALNPLELRVNFLARQISNLLFDSRSPARLIAINRAADMLDSSFRSPDLDTWIRGASRTNLLMIEDIFRTVEILASENHIVLTKVFTSSLRMLDRVDSIRVFTEYERAYFHENHETIRKLNIKL